MGAFRTRVKKKGKRWIKGQSSNSNPISHKFRNHAKNNFFKEEITEPTVSNLTVDSLRKHDTLVGSSNQSRVTGDDGRSVSENSCADNDAYSSYQSTTKTFDTFASDWTCCSNISFNKLINRFDLSSAHHKEMLAVLAAVTEVIKANGGTENTTEYFAALITTLEGINREESADSSVSAILSLLSMCIKSVPKNILQLKFAAVSKILMDQLKLYADSDHNIILKALIGCLKVLLCAQDVVVWNDSSTYTIFDAILAFIVHNKSKIRKSAQHAVCAILKGSIFMKNDSSLVSHPAAGHAAKHCVKLLESSISSGGTTTVLHVLTLLKEMIGTFPKAQTKTSCETILKLMTLGNPLVTSCSLQVLHGLFVSRPNPANCPATLNAQLITALYDYQPVITDTQPMLAWLAVMQEAFINLAKNDLSLCVSNLSKIFAVCTSALLSERREVITNSTLTMNAILKDCVALAALEQNYQQYETTLKKIFDILYECFYQNVMAQKQVLFLLGTMYKVCGRTCRGFMTACLGKLANHREDGNFQYGNELEQVFAFAIETIGPEIILKQVPLQIVELDGYFEINRSWLLPLFKDHIKNSTLKCFVEKFLNIATALKKANDKLDKEKNQARYVTYELLQSQIWALLPSFCDQPSDISETFPTIAESLGKILSSRKDLRQTVQAALRKLISSCANNENDKQTMSRFAKNYLPILFNIYTTPCKGTDEEATRFSAFETIKVYASIADSSLMSDMFKRALQKLDSEECEKSKFTKESILDLTRLLLPYQSGICLKWLYDKHITKVLNTENFKEEKKYYRLLEDLCACESEGCTEFIKKNVKEIKSLLLDSLSKAAVTSRGPRIRCLIHLLNHDSSEKTIFEYIPEAVLCCKDLNKRCRSSAFELVCKMADKVLEYGEASFAGFIDAVTAGLVGTSNMIAATILALACLIHYCKKSLHREQLEGIVKNICLLATSVTREIVGPAFGFIKMFMTAYEPNYVSTHLELIVKTLSSVTDDCKRRFRQKMRDIYDRLVRKFGAATIIAFVPTHDSTTMTRLKALKKLNDRKKKRKEKEKQQKADSKEDSDDDDYMFSAKSKPKTMEEILAECDDDSDELNDDSDESKDTKRNKKKSKKHNVYLQEDEDDIVDFTSSSANQKISTVHPDEKQTMGVKIKKKQTEFKTAPDGRLIIGEEKLEKLPNKSKGSDDDESDADDGDGDNENNLSNMLNDIVISRKRKMSSKDSEISEPPTKYQAGGSGIHRKINKTSNEKHNGSEYKSKKAKGDVKKKGMPDPYAYIPLSRNALNRRKKKKSAGQFKSLVRSAKKGAAAGSKNFKSKNRNRK